MSSTTDFGGVTSIRSLPGAVGGFFRWWGRELAACIPAALRSALRRRSGTLILGFEGDEAVLRFRRPSGIADIGRIAFDPEVPDAARGEISALASRPRRRSGQVVLVLPEDQVLRRTIELPLAARENLREVVSFEMDRYTPFAAEDVLFDVRPLSADADAQTLTVDLAAVPKASAARHQAVAAGWGLTPDVVCYADERESDNPDAGFVFRRPDVRRRGVGGRLAIVLWVCAALLAGALVALPLHRQRTVLAEQESRLAVRRAEAAAVNVLRERVAETAGISDLLVERKTARPAAVALLNEITRLLPDDTWLLQIRVFNDQLTMAGYSGAASALIPILEGSEMFAEVRFEAPVTLDGRINLERFNLSASIAVEGEEGS